MSERITVAALAIKVEGLSDQHTRLSDQLGTHLRECAANAGATLAAQRETNTALKSIADKVDAFEKLPMKAVRWLGGIVVVAIVTVLVQNVMLHADTANKATQAAQGQAQVIRKLDAMAPPAQ